MCEAGILFTVVTGISDRVEGQQFGFLRDDLHFVAQKFFPNGPYLPTAEDPVASVPLPNAALEQDISVAAPVQSLDTVSPPAAKQEQAFFVQMASVLLCHHRGQPVNSKAEVCVATGNVIIADFGQVDHND